MKRINLVLILLIFSTYVFSQCCLPEGITFTTQEQIDSFNSMAVRPLTEEELSWERTDLDKIYPTTSYQKIYNRLKLFIQQVDAAFKTNFTDELEKLVEDEKVRFAEKYGNKLAFVGGLDARVFETNDKEIIRREVAYYFEGMKARGARLVFASDHSISTNTHYQSYLYGLQVSIIPRIDCDFANCAFDSYCTM